MFKDTQFLFPGSQAESKTQLLATLMVENIEARCFENSDAIVATTLTSFQNWPHSSSGYIGLLQSPVCLMLLFETVCSLSVTEKRQYKQ